MYSKSRGPKLDTQQCVANAGGNKYNLVLMAAARAREVAEQHRNQDNNTYAQAAVTALLDVQNGQVGTEYLRKIRS